MFPSLVLAALWPALHAAALPETQAILQIEAQRMPPAALQDFVAHADPAVRARAALALGRLRTPSALKTLREMAADPDPTVRYEAAFALGQTPGSASALLERAAVEQDPRVLSAIYLGLGKEGGSDAVPVLVAALGERARLLDRPVGAEAAALALGRMARRNVEGVASPDALLALLAQLRRFDAPARYAGAFALSQIRPADPPPEIAAALWATLEDVHEPDVLARLLHATLNLKIPQEERFARYERLLAHPDPSVRIALARVGAKGAWPGVQALLQANDLPVRLEAIAAVAQVPGLDHAALLVPFIEAGSDLDADEAMRTVDDPRVLLAAAAVRALGSSEVEGAAALVDSGKYLELARPTMVRVAAAEVSSDAARLAALAREDGEMPVRTAAAGRLTELEPAPDGELMVGLLSAFDPVVVSIAGDWLAEHPQPDSEAALIAALEGAENIDLQLSVLKALNGLYTGTRFPRSELKPYVQALQSSPERAIREQAASLAKRMALPPQPEFHQVRGVDLEEAGAIRLARIQTTRGEALVELYPEVAPLTVWNFATLADAGFYDNLQVHRVVPDFVVQDGDPRGDGTGGPGWTIPDEINDLTYAEGTLGMAHAGPDTGGSQWFVTLSPQPHLDGVHTAFGRVIRGMQVFHDVRPGDRIVHIEIERYAADGTPLTPPGLAGE